MSSDFIKEKYLQGYPIPVSIDCTTIILEQMKKCICKINLDVEKEGTGFFCYIPGQDKKVMITNNHVVDENILKNNNKLTVRVYKDQEIEIDLNDKKIYTNIEYDTTIIEINKDEENKINDYIDYIDLDKSIFNKEKEIINKSIYILQYPKYYTGIEQIPFVSYGIIKNIEKYNIYHSCMTIYGSSGSPILNLLNNKVIGIQIDEPIGDNLGLGLRLQYPINDYLNSKDLFIKDNCISMKLKIEEEDIKKKIYFLDNTCKKNYINEKYQEYNHDNLKELNESNTQLFINDKKYKFEKYFVPEKIGNYKIKLKFNDNIKDCSFMFCNCQNIINIDLSSFNTKNVTDMKYMFSGCTNLEQLDLSYFKTKNVTEMSYMFFDCINLEKLDLSFFNTEKVTNMEKMFYCCLKLVDLDLSSFETERVTNMSHMFYSCKNIKHLYLNFFNTNEVTDMQFMFYNCFNLEIIDLERFLTTKVTNMSYLFYHCENITYLNLSSFNTKNVVYMDFMFAYCENLRSLDLFNFNTKELTNYLCIFENCTELKIVKMKEKKLNENLINSLKELTQTVSIKEN